MPRKPSIKPGTETPVLKTKEEKEKAVMSAVDVLTKTYGEGTVMKLGEAFHYNVDVIPTGSMGLDLALGVGGLPRGRIIEVYGPESSGKTTVALQAIAQSQKLGGIAAFIDVEHALDPTYAVALGVDINNLLVAQPDSGEQALEIMETLIRSGGIDCIVLDSVAAMVTKQEIDGEMGDVHMGLLARLMSQAMRKLTSVISKSNTVAIFINQVREKIGIAYGNPEITPGGRALKFYSSVRIEVRRSETIKKNGEPIGNRTRCKVVKNKVAPPFKECEFDMFYGHGVSRSGEVVDLATDLEIIKKSGSWYSYKGEKVAQGRDAVKEYLENNPDFMEEIEKLVMAKADEIIMLSKLAKKDEEDDKAKGDIDENELTDDTIINSEDDEFEDELKAEDLPETTESKPAEETPVESATKKAPRSKKKSVMVEMDDEDFEAFNPIPKK